MLIGRHSFIRQSKLSNVAGRIDYISIPKHEPIKKIYVEMVKQIVESEAKNDEDTE